MSDDFNLTNATLPMQHALQRAAFGLDGEDLPEAARAHPGPDRAAILQRPVVVDVQQLRKSFWIPDRSVRRRRRELHALRGVSFDVHLGEFFGIVGRNGSGKSTLLKVLASIYRADGGTIRIAGRLAPFIELGVGLNPELTARENVVLNGVMMGLGRREAARRLDAVLEFAELRSFVDLKLKNYSSGMMVRLAFAVMVQADADVMLIDEVLAVGDASFAEKCLEVFRERRRSGKTVVLVTHDMMTVQAFCDRAMLLHDGEQRYLGEPEQAVLRYYRLNFGGEDSSGASAEPGVRLVDAWLESLDGTRIENALHGEPFRFNLIVEARERLPEPRFGFQVLNVDDVPVFGFGKSLLDEDDEPLALEAGQRVRIRAEIDTPLVPGRFSVLCSIARTGATGDTAMHDVRVIDFLVRGSDRLPGMITVESEVETRLEHVVTP
jgi:ABC-2 type transport system ATP-binding protein